MAIMAASLGMSIFVLANVAYDLTRADKEHRAAWLAIRNRIDDVLSFVFPYHRPAGGRVLLANKIMRAMGWRDPHYPPNPRREPAWLR